MKAPPLFDYDRRAEQGPCSCPVAIDNDAAEAGANYPHTLAAHYSESCGGPSRPDPCGGCYDCVCAQWAYYARLAPGDAKPAAGSLETEETQQ